jgi:hypothetical protein
MRERGSRNAQVAALQNGREGTSLESGQAQDGGHNLLGKCLFHCIGDGAPPANAVRDPLYPLGTHVLLGEGVLPWDAVGWTAPQGDERDAQGRKVVVGAGGGAEVASPVGCRPAPPLSAACPPAR